MTDTMPGPGDALRAALMSARGADPQQAAEAQRRARQLGAPQGALNDVPRQDWPTPPGEFDADAFLREYPNSGRFLSNPDHARVAGDAEGRQALSEMEVILRGTRFADDEIRPLYRPSTPGQWLRGLATAVTSGESWQGAGIALADALGLWRNPSEREFALRDLEQETARIEMARPEIEGNIASGVYGGLESTARLLPGTLLSLAVRNPTPVLATAGAMTGGEAYGRYAGRGATPGEAALGATGEAAVEIATELIPMGRLVRAFGADGARRFITDIGASVLADIPGEQLATLAQDAIDTAIANPDKTWADYLEERPDAAVQTLVATLTQSTIMAGAVGGLRAASNYANRRGAEAAQAETDASTIQNLAEAAANSVLRQRSPETFEAFIAEATEGGPVSDVYIDAQVLAQSGVNIEELRQAVPAVDQQLDQALTDGGDVRIPVEQFAARIAGTDAAAPLIDHLRINPALPSRAEVSALGEEANARLQAEAEQVLTAATTDDAFRQSAARVEQSILDQLQTAGRFTRDVNSAYASLVGNFYTVQAQRLGITPEQMAERYPLQIRAEAPQAERAVTLDQPGFVRLTHFSGETGLAQTDPTRWGQNAATPAGERERARLGDAPPRTYFYDMARRPSGRPEDAIAPRSPFSYEADVEASRLYDFDADPDGLRAEGATPGAYEQAIRGAGYVGYRSDATVQGAVAIFDPVEIRQTGALRTWADFHALDNRMRDLQSAERLARAQSSDPNEIVTAAPLEAFREQAMRELFPETAADDARYAPLDGAPRRVKSGDGFIRIAPHAPARDAAYAYMESSGLRYEPPTAYAKVDAGRAKRLANAFDQMAHAPNDPLVRAAYNAMIEETLAQYQIIKATGLEIEFITGADPYAASPRMAIQDVIENNHLWVFPTDDGFGGSLSADVDISGNPLLGLVDEWIGDRQLRANDVFRIVHDYFGHIKDGNGFRADGEENAWQSHAAMYSPLARRAMTTETRGQNSWVNYGPFADFNRTASAAETQYAPQKIGLLPEWASSEGFLGGENSGVPEGQVLEQGPVDTESAAFKAWFGNSKVVDENGDPLVVYHGTNAEFEAFEPSAGDGNVLSGVYFTPDRAEASDEYGDRLVAAYVSVKNPASPADVAEAGQEAGEDGTDVTAALIAKGFDGAITSPLPNGHVVAFSPTQIKSAIGNRGTFDPTDANIYNQSEVRPHPAFYSALARAVAKSPLTKAPAAQWKATLAKTPGVKKDEIEWSGINEWLDAASADEFQQRPFGQPSEGALTDAKGNISREAVLAFLENGGVQVEERVLGGGLPIAAVSDFYIGPVESVLRGASDREDAILRLENDYDSYQALSREARRGELPSIYDEEENALRDGWAEEVVDSVIEDAPDDFAGPAQFSQYKLPGADETYREILLTLPNIDGPSTHWDEPNVIAHARITAREDAEGARVLFLEEVQSDWHQKGRDEGYQREPEPEEVAAANTAYAEAQQAVSVAEEPYADAVRALVEARIAELEAVRGEADAAGGSVAEVIADQINAQKDALVSLSLGADPASILNRGSLALVRTPEVEEAARRLTQARLEAREARIARDALFGGGIPDAPFRSTWPQLVMKRMIRYAVDNGFDKIAWINGNQQNGGLTGGDGSFFYERNLVNATNDVIKRFGGRVAPVDMRDETARVRAEERRTSGAETRRELLSEAIAEGDQAEIDRAQQRLDGYLAAIDRPNDVLGIQNGFTITDKMREQAREGFALFQNNRGQISFGMDITQSPTVISLLRSADLSTFLHETGHFFLEVTRDMAMRDDAPPEIRQDMDTVLSWFGVESLDAWNALSPEEKRPHHETFARGFEAYLFEGRAPTPGLRDLFQRFRSWLVNVYRSIARLNVELTDEVRGVMDRMVAASDEIAAAEAHRGFTPMTEKPPYMTDEAWEDYQRTFTDATIQGADTLTTRSVRDMRWLSNARSRTLKRLQAQAREQRRQVKAEVTAEVMAEPVNRARSYLRRGLDENGDPIPGAGKLDLDILRQMYGDAEDAPWRALRAGGKFGEAGYNGLHPDVVAELFGYDSGDALVRDLATAEDANEKIAGLTDQRMLERYGDIADEAALQRAADEAIANEAHSRAIATDYAALAQATGQPRALASAARTHAAGIVNRIELKRLKPNQFFAAMTRAGKAADQAARAGDLTTAATQRRNQLINLQAAKYAIEARAEVDKGLTRFQRIVAGKDEALSRSRDMALVNAARAILSAYGIGRVRNDPASYLERVKSYDPQLYADIQPFVEGARGAAKPIHELTFEQFQGLRDTVLQLWALSRRVRQVEIDGQLVDINTARDALAARLDEIGYPVQAGAAQAPTPQQRFGRMLQGARASLRRVEHWVRGIDSADTGAFRTYIWQPVSTAADVYRIEQHRYLRRFLDIVQPIESTLTRAKIAAPELGYTFTGKAELLHAILHTGNQSNMSKLLLGRRWGKQNADGSLDTTRWDAFLSRAWSEGILTRADYVFAQGVWDLLEETKPGAQRAHRAMYGRYFSEVSADPIQTPWGEFRGGYVPATTDAFLVQDAQLRSEQEALEDSNAFMFPAASNGFTKARVEDYTRELSLDIRLLPMHIDKVLRFTHLGPPVRDVARILKGRDFSAKLAAFDPVAQTDLLLPWLQRSARQVVQEPMKGQGGKLVDGFFRELRTRTGMQLMFANLSNTMQQLTGFSNAAVRVKPSKLAASMWGYVRDPKGTAEAVTGLSNYMATRTSSQVFEMRQTLEQLLLNPTKYEKLRDWSNRHAYFTQFAFQNVVDVTVWRAAYDQAVERGDDDLAAIRFADSVVRETQQSMAPEDVSRFETGTAFQRAFTQFYSYFNNQANMLGTEFQATARTMGVRKGAGRLLYVYTFGYAVPALLAEAIAQMMRGGFEDDEDDGYLDEFFTFFFGAQVSFGLAAVPVAGQTINAAIGGFTPAAYDDRVSTSPAISVVESGARLPAVTYQAIVEGEGFKARDVRDLMNMLGLITGTPLGAVGRPASYAYGVAQGDIEPTSAVDAARGLATGTASPESRTN